ncbi:MAG TPA: hypothetical protein VIY29_19320 [Ktedonobacteraceae bacterium]
MFKHTEIEGAYQAKPWRLSLSLTGGLVLLVGVVLLVWFLFLRPPVRPSMPSVQYSSPQPPLPLSVVYEDAVKQSLAQQLRVDVSQLVHETQANPDGLFGIADARSLSQDQLHTMLLNAFQSASNRMVNTGHWTHQQAGTEMQYWKQREFKALAGDVSSWLLS